ncbi:hypothetical protein [Microbulbifer aestuariivivens]
MNKRRNSVVTDSIVRSSFAIPVFLSLISPSAALSQEFPVVASGMVPLLWLAAVSLALLATLTTSLLLWRRLRREARISVSRLTKLQSERDSLNRQLRHYEHKVKERNKKLSEAQRSISELRQSKSDLQVMIGHQLCRPLENLRETLQRVAAIAHGESAALAGHAHAQLQPIIFSLNQIQHLGHVEALAVNASLRASNMAMDETDAQPLKILNVCTLEEKRGTLDHQTFADQINQRAANLPKQITKLTSALTDRQWSQAQQCAAVVAANAEEIGLDAIAGLLRNLSVQLTIDSERDYCRQQRIELLNLMRRSIQQLQEWKAHNLHTEWALQ